MYVCVCNAVTDKDIRGCVERGASSLFDVQNELPVGSCCGRCQETAQAVVDEHLNAQKARPATRFSAGSKTCRIAA